MTSTSNVKLMWVVVGMDVDHQWNSAVCYSREAAKKLADKLDSAQDDPDVMYTYYVTTVRVHEEEEDTN